MNRCPDEAIRERVRCKEGILVYHPGNEKRYYIKVDWGIV